MTRATFNSYSAYEESKLFNRMLTVGQVLSFSYTIDPNLLDLRPLTNLALSSIFLSVLILSLKQHFRKFFILFVSDFCQCCGSGFTIRIRI
jgi:hypothetical protein